MDLLKNAIESVHLERVQSPYATEEGLLKVSFSDPLLSGYEVTVMADTGTLHAGERLTTLVARFPRSILSEVNTHRVFSRNSASSRARSVRSTVDDVMSAPYVPVFTRNQKGMSGSTIEDIEMLEQAREYWLRARDSAVAGLFRLLLGHYVAGKDDTEIIDDRDALMDLYYDEVYNKNESGAPSIHKQDANRLLEPFMWHEAVISATEWQNFLDLRLDFEAAHPSIVAMAVLVNTALAVSIPVRHWAHLPFVPLDEVPEQPVPFAEIRPLSMQSATEAARVSYKDTVARARVENSALGERLLEQSHLSPFEHVAFTADAYSSMELSDTNIPTYSDSLAGNFDIGWVQLRRVLTD